MSDLRPLLEEDANSIEADILRQARSREPSPGAAGRALVVLGLAGAATTATVSATAAPVAVLVAKWVGVGALSAVLVIGGGQIVSVVATKQPALATSGQHLERSPKPSPTPAGIPSPIEAPATESVYTPPVAPEPGPSAVAPKTRSVARTPLVVEEREPPTRAVLDAEIALLDAARDAVAVHDPNRALRLLDDHRLQFPNGQLSQEATYVRVKALLERGSRAEAEQTARLFLQAHPETPHAKRIRALFGQ